VTCKTEEERVQALEKWFDIHLTYEERKGIMGMVTELDSYLMKVVAGSWGCKAAAYVQEGVKAMRANSSLRRPT
jgi:hypothetical protein